MTLSPLLICTDLDRTLIPNGGQPESPGAMDLFRELVSRPHVSLAFVTGRHRALVEDAIEEYGLPQPDYVIADVGTTIYEINAGEWSIWERWQQEIGAAWAEMSGDEIHALLQDIVELRPQERQKQNRFKLSYYVPMKCRQGELEREIVARLKGSGVRADLVWSIDNQEGVGLLDILPESATKEHAIGFIMDELGFDLGNTIFAGDSGNDISVLASPIRSVLVANATDEVRRAALQEAEASLNPDAIYLAKGGFNGMNGNYCAGILEGVAHYLPQYASLIRRWQWG